jgi:hypothetical protein
VRVHLAREHARELELLDLAFELRGIGLHVRDRALVVLELGEFKEFDGAGDAVPDAVEALGEPRERRAFLAEGLRLVRVVPDLGVLELARYLGETLTLAVVFKDTPLRRRGDPRDP